MTLRAIRRLRVSSKKQERSGHSLDAQDDATREYCEREGFQVVAVIRETGSASRYRRKRLPGHDQAIQMLRAGEADLIVVADFDRYTRTPRDAEELIELLEEGHQVHTVRRGSLQRGRMLEPEDLYMIRLEAARAALETDIISRRVTTGMEKRAALGLPMGPIPPGLRHVQVDDRRLVDIDPVQAPLVRALFEEVADGLHSIKSAAHRAEELGIVGRRGKPLRRSTVGYLLRNPVVAGYLKGPNGTRVKGSFPAVVPENVWFQVQGRLDGNRRQQPGAGRRSFALGQLMRCGLCGCAVVIHRVKRPAGVYLYARCCGARGECPAASQYVPCHQLLGDAAAILGQLRIGQKTAAALRRRATEMLEADGKGRRGERGRIDRRVAELDELILDTSAARVAGAIPGRAADKLIARYEAEQSGLAARRTAIGVSAVDLGKRLGDLLDLCRGSSDSLLRIARRSPREARDLLRYMLDDEILLQDGRLVAKLREPFHGWATLLASVTSLEPGPGAEAAGGVPRLRLLAEGPRVQLGKAALEAASRGETREAVQQVGDAGRDWNSEAGVLRLLAAPALGGHWADRVLSDIRAAA